jgi:hypothetical protein
MPSPLPHRPLFTPQSPGSPVPVTPLSPIRTAFVPRGLDVPITATVLPDRAAWFRRWLYVLACISDGCLSTSGAVRGAALKELKVGCALGHVLCVSTVEGLGESMCECVRSCVRVRLCQ